MKTTFRQYQPYQDEASVSDLLEKTCPPATQGPNWLGPRWEYMIYSIHGGQQETFNSFGLWHAEGQLVGAAHFESGLGEAFLQVHPDHAYLKADMLEYAESALCRDEGETKTLDVCIDARDRELEQLARASGFVQAVNSPGSTTQLKIKEPFPVVSLPEGYSLTDRAESKDLNEINRVLWRGFNHDGPPPEQYVAGRADVEKAPLYRPELTVMVKAPDGHLASYCGMWYAPANRLAYVEPVATDPDHRRQGLARAAVLEAIRRAGRLGATRAIVGSGLEFYRALGFRTIATCYPWRKGG